MLTPDADGLGFIFHYGNVHSKRVSFLYEACIDHACIHRFFQSLYVTIRGQVNPRIMIGYLAVAVAESGH